MEILKLMKITIFSVELENVKKLNYKFIRIFKLKLIPLKKFIEEELDKNSA